MIKRISRACQNFTKLVGKMFRKFLKKRFGELLTRLLNWVCEDSILRRVHTVRTFICNYVFFCITLLFLKFLFLHFKTMGRWDWGESVHKWNNVLLFNLHLLNVVLILPIWNYSSFVKCSLLPFMIPSILTVGNLKGSWL